MDYLLLITKTKKNVIFSKKFIITSHLSLNLTMKSIQLIRNQKGQKPETVLSAVFTVRYCFRFAGITTAVVQQ